MVETTMMVTTIDTTMKMSNRKSYCTCATHTDLLQQVCSMAHLLVLNSKAHA